MIAIVAWLAAAHATTTAPPPGPVAGDYALVVRFTTATRAPFVGWVHADTITTSRVRLSEGSDGWAAEQVTCEVEIDGGAPARTTVPPAFVASLSPQRYAIRTGEAGRALRADPGPTWVGQQADGTVLDQEGDGHPGATVWVDVPVIGRVDVYVAQHAHTVLDGQWTPAGAVGRVEVITMNQRTLGASNRLLASDRPTRLVEDGSRFALVPIPEGTCVAARQAASQVPSLLEITTAELATDRPHSL